MQRIALMAVAALVAVACNNEITGLEPPSDPATETFAPSLGVDIASMEKTTSGVYYEDVIVGTGLEVTTIADSVQVDYAGWLRDGTLFDNGSNVRMRLAQVVPGFRDGMVGMKVGGTRKIVIPSELGYGNRARRTDRVTIPRQSTLVFEVELKNVWFPDA